MTDVTVSVRVDKALHQLMKAHDEINWASILRRSITETIDRRERIDTAKATEACKRIDALRKKGMFHKGKSSTEIIREWREKRR